MWIRIRAVIIEDEPLAAQYLAELLDETCQVEVVGSATESEAGLVKLSILAQPCPPVQAVLFHHSEEEANRMALVPIETMFTAAETKRGQAVKPRCLLRH